MVDEPSFTAPIAFHRSGDALAQIAALYEAAVAHLRGALNRFVAGADLPHRVRACYPYVRGRSPSARLAALAGQRPALGLVAGPGVYETTITRPDVFGAYLREQLRLLLENHGHERGIALEVGVSRQPIPLHFALADGDHLEGELSAERRARLREVFDLPDLSAMDDGIANGTWQPLPGEPYPLALFTAPRVDYSLQRLRHYTGTSVEAFQNFVLLTNYAFYVDEFVRVGREAMQDPASDYIALVEPGNVLTPRAGEPDASGLPGARRLARLPAGSAPPRLPQMPAYHLVRADGSGITLVNIGVGPSNAKTITDHIAVLRPHAWLMLGHCAGLRSTQALGDYVLAHGYVREDHVLDEELPVWVPIPALAEVQVALERAVADVTQMQGPELKRIMRTGTVCSTDNRNWELLPSRNVASTPQQRMSQSRAVALDMESATIAANGFRFRVPYGTLLCVSDKPLHGEIKLPGMANHFYRERVDQHLRIGLRAVELLRQQGAETLHSRKLRSFAEVAFQ